MIKFIPQIVVNLIEYDNEIIEWKKRPSGKIEYLINFFDGLCCIPFEIPKRVIQVKKKMLVFFQNTNFV